MAWIAFVCGTIPRSGCSIIGYLVINRSPASDEARRIGDDMIRVKLADDSVDSVAINAR